ncbi:uncharacterized protein TM35_000023990 [Trypanosoma theileri]|uniref:Uncharacterized protein n=1 Tax=Trypanosoma theileri TaxID=67003 RepID=A0A1X0P8W6_9TRYP|nr:uncharacterized protein TM35_000023990 [Trypanosoma theileri]ORC93073.1 hypothetical protein TM35_000023990 [Trypanosoma theileri]
MIFQASRFSASGREIPLEPRRSEARRSHTNPTDDAVEWSSNTECPSHSQCTHNDSLTCSCQRGTTAFTKMYTKSPTYRERKRKTQKKNNNNRIPTAHKALTIQ